MEALICVLCFQLCTQGKPLSCCQNFTFVLSVPGSQLSQPGACLENRVPTPASAADLHSQHVAADLPVQEVKAEARHDLQEFKGAGVKTEPKMEVG